MTNPIKVADSAKDMSARRTGIGASEAPVVFGLSEYKTVFDLYQEKRGEAEPIEETFDMRRGTYLEPWVITEFARLPGLPRVELYDCGMFRHPDVPCVLASPDAILEGNEGLEVKSIHGFRRGELGEQGSDQIPRPWLAQAQQQMAVMGWKAVRFAVLVDVREILHFRVERHDGIIARILEVEARLWDMIQAGTPPHPDQWATSIEAVKRAFKTVEEGEAVPLSEYAVELLAEAWQLDERAKADGLRADQLKAQAYSEIGSAQWGIIGDGEAIKRIVVAGGHVSYDRKESVQYRRCKVPKGLTVRESNPLAIGANPNEQADLIVGT